MTRLLGKAPEEIGATDVEEASVTDGGGGKSIRALFICQRALFCAGPGHGPRMRSRRGWSWS